MNRLFNLPDNILSTIYNMDNTFRDKLKQCHHDIWKKSFVRFRYEFLSNQFFENKPILKNKIKYLFEFLFDNYDKEQEKYNCWFKYEMHTEHGEHSMFSKPMPSDIVINATWKKQNFKYINGKFEMDARNTDNDIDDVDDNFNISTDNWTEQTLYISIRVSYFHKTNFHRRDYGFRGNVYSNKHYNQNLKDEEEWDQEEFVKITNYGTRATSPFDLFKIQNEEFSIIQSLYG